MTNVLIKESDFVTCKIAKNFSALCLLYRNMATLALDVSKTALALDASTANLALDTSMAVVDEPPGETFTT